MPVTAETRPAEAAAAAAAAAAGPFGMAASTTMSTAIVSRLMGGPRRRGRSVRFRCDELIAPHAAVHAALHELVDASSFRIR